MRFELFIASRYLRAKRKQAVIGVITGISIAGVAAVIVKESHNNRGMFEIESEKNFVRGDLARVVVESGWDLNELRPTAMSLEEIFLQLTREEAVVKTEKPAAEEAKALKVAES